MPPKKFWNFGSAEREGNRVYFARMIRKTFWLGKRNFKISQSSGMSLAIKNR
jgi:hypothetical protein